MKIKYLRMIIAVMVIVGITLLAKGQIAWAGMDNDVVSVSAKLQGDSSASNTVELGSVKPPPPKINICENGLYSVGGVVVMDVKDLRSGYCVEAELSNPKFPLYPVQPEAGDPLAHFLFVRIYLNGSLTDELPFEDGTVDACYAIPPEKQAQFYFYDYYWKRFDKRTEAPLVWDAVDTRVDDDNKIACAFTQYSGVYGLLGK